MAIRVLAIDPGDVHVGMAYFEDPRCLEAWEYAPDQALDYVRDMLRCGRIDTLVIEEFRLYPWRARAQAFSQMLTCEMIGALKIAWRWYGVDNGIELAVQSAQIKEPTSNILRARKVPSVAKRSRAGGHAFDAELHGHYYLEHRKADGLTVAEATKKASKR